MIKLRDVSGIERKLSELNARHETLKREADASRLLVEALPSPVWVRDATGRLALVNSAYARAVEAADAANAVTQGIELFDRAARAELDRAAGAESRMIRLPAVVAGHRRTLDHSPGERPAAPNGGQGQDNGARLGTGGRP